MTNDKGQPAFNPEEQRKRDERRELQDALTSLWEKKTLLKSVNEQKSKALKKFRDDNISLYEQVEHLKQEIEEEEKLVCRLDPQGLVTIVERQISEQQEDALNRIIAFLKQIKQACNKGYLNEDIVYKDSYEKILHTKIKACLDYLHSHLSKYDIKPKDYGDFTYEQNKKVKPRTSIVPYNT